MRQINLVLTPAEARALHAQLADDLQTIREYGLCDDELPLHLRRLERVYRGLTDGLTYLAAEPWGRRVSVTHHGANVDCPQVRSGEWKYCQGHPLHPARSA